MAEDRRVWFCWIREYRYLSLFYHSKHVHTLTVSLKKYRFIILHQNPIVSYWHIGTTAGYQNMDSGYGLHFQYQVTGEILFIRISVLTTQYTCLYDKLYIRVPRLMYFKEMKGIRGNVHCTVNVPITKNFYKKRI
jgi:hypothetical protein